MQTNDTLPRSTPASVRQNQHHGLTRLDLPFTKRRAARNDRRHARQALRRIDDPDTLTLNTRTPTHGIYPG